MRLICTSRYRGEDGDGNIHDYKEGQEINVPDRVGAHLLRTCPAAFADPSVRVAKAKAEAPDEADVAAMSTETATGIVAPDRRARGGKVRGK